ncbi:MAG TPA: cyclohexa-1,5-dienecarbonyl-CoA hydratase [Rhodobacteraceae bacterium]|nr:cyclohexa-1,5-dienecarbonyl-CoA hydratase [Paracoccaceae bacterium]
MTGALKTWLDRDGTLLRLRLSRPKANIIDAEMIAALDSALAEHAEETAIAAVLIDHEGPHFSFGASVEEHLPESCAAMLAALHGLIKRMIAWPRPILVAAGGQCLGGGLEIASAGDLLFVASDARLGQPEMKLGVFAPAASALLPERIGQYRANDLLFSGRSISGAEAAAIGLASDVADNPETAALAWFDGELAEKSAASLGFAVKAARMGFAERVMAKLDAVEKLYLDGLMATHDAVEGLEAFLEKRPARWENR